MFVCLYMEFFWGYWEVVFVSCFFVLVVDLEVISSCLLGFVNDIFFWKGMCSINVGG